MNEPKPIIVGNYKPSGHGCGKIHYGGGDLINSNGESRMCFGNY